MNCNFSKELLALHVSQDLSSSDSRLVSTHVEQCTECRNFLDQLSHRQSQLRLLRMDTTQSSDFAALRRDVLAHIGDSRSSWGWFKIERFLLLGFRRHAFACASLAVAAIVSATLFAQMRQPLSRSSEVAAVFSGKDTLVLPDNYRNWVLLGNSTATTAGSTHANNNAKMRSVYMDRRGYREFTKSGQMPEGAVLILELSSAPGKGPAALQASVKDNRFEGGWGFFDFTKADGGIQSQANVAADSTCRSCHERRAPFDHVFTTVQEILKSAENVDTNSHSIIGKC